MNELFESPWDVRKTKDKKDDHNAVFCALEKCFHIEPIKRLQHLWSNVMKLGVLVLAQTAAFRSSSN